MEKDTEIPLLLPPQESQNPNPNSSHGDPQPDDVIIPDTNILSREEVLRRRSRMLKQLKGIYKEQMWALAEEIRVRHRDFYWQFGQSPIEEEGSLGSGEERKKCTFSGCKAKAMPLTKFCHQHVMLDGDQKLYKACYFVVRNTQSGPIICKKPVSTIPSLCPTHLQKTERNISQAFKKAGLSSTPKFHGLVHEFVKQINDKRRQKRRGKSAVEDDLNKKHELDTTGRTFGGKMVPSCGVSITSMTTRRDSCNFVRKQVNFQPKPTTK